MEFEQRMYHLVMYNLSPIQQGIQAYHSAIEYSLEHGHHPEYQRWAKIDKTVIILNGGTSNRSGTNEYNDKEVVGTMEMYLQAIHQAGYPSSLFSEPDLNNATSAIAFLVDERVWNRVKYPEPSREDILKPGETAIHHLTQEEKDERFYNYYFRLFNDGTIAWLRLWLKQFQLA